MTVADFRTERHSEGPLDARHLHFVTVKSKALRRRADVSVFVPPGADASTSMPLVILLHGVYGSHWAWPFKGKANTTALEMIQRNEIGSMVIAMPSDGLWGDGSGYLKHTSADYEAWIVEEAPKCAALLPGLEGGFTNTYIGGLSMGGYGALRLGAKYCDRFSGISAHSAITRFDELALFVEEPLESYEILNEEDADVLHWMNKHQDRLPPLRFDCGTGDLLIEGNRKLHAELERIGLEHCYEEFPGEHSWDYWKEHLRETLRFFDRVERSKTNGS